MKTEDRADLHIYLDKQMLTQLKAAAVAEGRTLTGQVRWMLQKKLDEQELAEAFPP